MNNHHDHGHGFFNGLVLGVIIGAAVVFFFGTKKGRKMFKMLTENGFEGLEELQDLFQNSGLGDFDDEYTDEEVQEPKHETASKALRPVKRFFRGVKK